MQLVLNIPDIYPSIVLASVIICIECYLTGFVTGFARHKHFTPKFMKENFGKELINGKISHPAVLGNPDNGSGRHSEKLDYAAWFHFNCCVRVHQNFVETLPMILTAIMVGGLIVPDIAFYVAWVNVVFRIVYLVGYVLKGPNFRMFGVLTATLSVWVMLGYITFVLGNKVIFE